jgi:hypothetical protein
LRNKWYNSNEHNEKSAEEETKKRESLQIVADDRNKRPDKMKEGVTRQGQICVDVKVRK